MDTATLDIRSKHNLTIKSDLDKNFSVVLSGFDNLDTSYTLTLSREEFSKVFEVGTDIILDSVNKILTLVFTGSDYTAGNYTGTLESENKDADTFYRNDITLTIE